MPEAERQAALGSADDLDLLREAAKEAGAIALRYFRKSPEVWWKPGSSPVSEADYAVDRFLRETLLDARPDYGWLSEETADTPERLSARRTFVVDPIDGTRGFLEGLDQWCVSVAVVENARPIVGVLECPAMEKSFSAVPGQGAFLNGRPLAVRDPGARLAMGGPKALVDRMPEQWRSRFDRVAHVPSLAYRIARIAEGSLDASFVKPDSHDWDLAAADLILAEAGGSLVDRNGAIPAYAGAVVRHGVLAAGHGPLLEAMVDAFGAA